MSGVVKSNSKTTKLSGNEHVLKKTYFDYLSTTPLDPRVLDAMLPYAVGMFGNPHSRNHSYGWEAENALEAGRAQIARLINANSKEIVFTSGATESDNLALKGVAEYFGYDLHIITSHIEHKAVLETCRYLEEKGVRVTYLPTNSKGQICLKQLRAAIRPDTRLVSLMAVNNEIGTINPLKEIGDICAEHGIIFHCDAAQGYGKIPIDVRNSNIGLMSISGHKIYGPKGIGALYVRRNPRVRIKPLFHGGSQERGLRSGTTPAFLAAGLGKAAEVAFEEMKRDEKHVSELADLFLKILSNKLGPHGFIKNGEHTVPGCLNLSFPFVEGEGLLMKLKNFALSSGSACTSASLEPSYVLRALGTAEDLAHSSIRFGFGRFTNKEDVERLADATAKAVKELRDMSPLYEMHKDGIDLSAIKWTA